MARVFPEDDDLFSELEAWRLRANAYRRAATPTAAQNTAALARQLQRMGVRPDAIYALSKAGHTPDSPLVQRVGELGAKRKAKKGFGWHSIGDVVSAVGRTAGDVVEDVGETAAHIGKGALRVGLTVLEAPLQELQGAARGTIKAVAEGDWGNLAEYVGEAGGSTARLAIGDILEGKRVDLGSGFLPGGDLAEEQERLARRLKLNGEWISIGRTIADVVSEPGSKPYRYLSGVVDGAVTVFGDPALWLTGGAGKAATSRKLFTAAPRTTTVGKMAERAGLVQARTRAVIPEKVESWLASPEAGNWAEVVASKTDFNEIRRLTGGKLKATEITELIDAQDAVRVKEVLRRNIFEGELREKFSLSTGVRPQVRKTIERVRILQQMPGKHIDFNDLDDAVDTLDRFQRNAKLPEDVISRNNERLARSQQGNRYEVLDNTMDAVKEALVARGLDEPVARRLVQMKKDLLEESRIYAINRVGEKFRVSKLLHPDGELPLTEQHMLIEYLDNVMPLPDARDIRRQVSALRPVFNIPGVSKSLAVTDWAMQQLWKPAVLIRGAWTVRVIAEEQMRMGASGLTSAFAHPLSYIAWAASSDSRVGKAVSKLGIQPGRGSTGITGKLLSDADEHLNAMSVGSMGLRDRTVAHRLMTKYRPGDDHFNRAWADEIIRFSSDPVLPRALRNADDTKEWFFQGPGMKFRKALMETKPEFADRAYSDAWIDSLVDRAREMTNDDPDLLELIASRSVRKGQKTAQLNDAIRPSKELMEVVKAKAATLPPEHTVKGWLRSSVGGGSGGFGEMYDRAVESMFNVLMSQPTNKLSRSPAFRQLYWNRVEELLPSMDAAAQQKVGEAARAAGLGKDQLRRLAVASSQGTGKLALDQADIVAKGFALDGTRNLLYSLDKRSQFFDVTRLLMPFGEAWKEILTSWARIGYQSGGRPLVRAKHAVEGARGAGWFMADPMTGEEIFHYPGSEIVSGALTGVPTPLVGSVSGLSLATSVLPGFGPVVQVPASKLIPDKPEWDWAREIINPYGEPYEEGILNVRSHLPRFMQRVMQAWDDPESDRIFGNTVTDVMRYLASTGEYSTASPEEMDRLYNAAVKRARVLYVFRGLSQFGAPAAPRFQFQAQDQEGRNVVAQTLLDDWYRFQQEDWDTAPSRFLEKWGDDAILFMQSKSRSVVGGLPVSKEGSDWVRANADIVRRYPNIYGFFAPEGDPEDFQIAAYNRQLETGEREPLTPREVLQLANAKVGRMLYKAAERKAGDSQQGREWLGKVKEAIKAQYPGFGETIGLAERAKFPQLLDEVMRAAEEPKIRDSEAGQGLTLYLQARQRAVESAQSLGGNIKSFGKAKKARPVREWLRQVADGISRQYPDFGPVFENLLEREFEADDSEAAEVA